jgi:hypothetical protein
VRFIADHESISTLAHLIKKTLGKVDAERLEIFARELGIDIVLKTPLVSRNGGILMEFGDQKKMLLYYGLLPIVSTHWLAHEIGHAVLGHLSAIDGV